MVRRCGVMLFAFAVAASVHAQYPQPPLPFQYIIPVTGDAEGYDTLFHSSTRIINTGKTPADLTFEFLRSTPSARCIDTPATVPAGGSATLGARCEGIYAAIISSKEVLYVRSAVQSWGKGTFLNGPDEEPIDVATSFIAPGQTVLIPDVQLGLGWRANLVLVNPNVSALTVNVYADRADTSGSPDAVFSVEPRSLKLVPSTAIPWGRGDGVTGTHDLRLTGDQLFQAGTSSLRPTGNAQYRGAVVVNR